MGNDADDILTAVGDLLPDAGAKLAGVIRESRWSTVLRARADAPRWTGPESMIVKRFPESGTGWARECSALAVVPADAPAPRLIASSADPPLVVMTDAGGGPSVADALLHGTAAEASAALEEFADTLAAFHLSTLGVAESFSTQLAAQSGGPPSTMPEVAKRAASDLETWCARLGVSVPDGALAELAALPDRIAASGPSTLTLADSCPDNNIRVDGGFVLIDFEEAEWRPVAWDAAYFTVPWPGCWCSFGLPRAIADRTLDRYRSAVAERLPYAATPEFATDVVLTRIGWGLMSASWYIGSALGDDPPQHDEAGKTPTRRARILHYLATTRDTEAVPELTELARCLRLELVRRWGEIPLPYAPAFRGRGYDCGRLRAQEPRVHRALIV